MAKKNSLAEFDDGDLRRAHSNILLLGTLSAEAKSMLDDIAQEAYRRDKEFIVSISEEEVRNRWITARKPIDPKFDSIIAERIPNWIRTDEIK